MTIIRGIIFDMDGVLIDAREWHYEALNLALALFGHTISRQQHLRAFDGLPTREKLQRLSVIAGLPLTLHSFINQMKQHYTLRLISEHCNPVPMHQHALACLKQAGYRLAVASNSVRGSVDNMLHKAGLQQFLEFTLSNEDVAQGKPHPEIYTKAINQMGLKPQECVVVEDNPHGIAAAEAAGAHVLRVADPSEVSLTTIQAFIRQCEEQRVF
jgi:HAD superfamily hydrolase (TIGR01509 family)